ncbi:indolepyruvate ferredoxin oxidoreductase subunit alpha [Microbacterium insulae]|uniref:Ferredoxin n=1 Tax=Microbacterium insulae TaxID=483014 RepID=A0ABW3AH01_9MICO
MAYVISNECIGEMDGSCVDVCPVDCIYEGLEKRYIQPDECIDCGACLTACPVSAIQAPADGQDPLWVADNRAFFALPLPTRSDPIGSPGGATDFGPVGVDTPLVAEIAEG